MSNLKDSYPVVIIGGGPVGLISSILLSLQGIPHMLFERYSGTSIHPKAVGINQRTSEILRKIGVEDEVRRQAAPPEMSGRTAWYTSLGKSGLGKGWAGREIASRYAWGAGPQYAPNFEKASPARYFLLPQIRLEPILKRRAEELNPEGIWFGYDVVGVEEKNDHVILAVQKQKCEGQGLKFEATWVIGADGGRGLANKMGMRWNGESDVIDMVSAHIRAPISKYHPDRSIFISWFVNPEMGGSINTGYLYHLGPYPIQQDTEEWCFACAFLPHERGRTFGKKEMRERMKDVLKLEGLDEETEILSLSTWHVNAKVVERYRSNGGRVFFVGDAAHRIPPWGALGMNSGAQDADNLVWKLALAIKRADKNWNGLLDTYDEERRPIGERVARTGLKNMRSHGAVVDAALGISPDNPVQANVEAVEQFFDMSDEREGAEKRKLVKIAVDKMDIEFYAHGAEVGWYYESADIEGEGMRTAHDGQAEENGEMKLIVYRPSTIPGHQVPHAYLTDRNGRKKSTRDMIRRDQFVLLAKSRAWQSISHEMIEVIVINGSESNWTDADGVWSEHCGVGPSGAVLVRPDGIVAYRFQDDKLASQRAAELRIRELVNRLLKL